VEAPPRPAASSAAQGWPSLLPIAWLALALFLATLVGRDADLRLTGDAVAWWRSLALAVGAAMALPLLAVICVAARRAGVSRRTALVAALVMILLSEGFGGWVSAVAGVALGVPEDVRAWAITPPVEEALKVAAIVLAFRVAGAAPTIRAGVVVGAVIGLAFNLLELAGYAHTAAATDPAMLPASFALRVAAGGFGLHVGTGALLGAGLGWAVSVGGPPRHRAAGLGLAMAGAVVTHALWNAQGIVEAFTRAFDPGYGAAAPTFVAAYGAASLGSLFVIGPAFAGVVYAWRRARG